jgi:hypothetical protein
MLSNNKVFILPSGDYYLLGVLNSPLMWWHNWRFLPHMKDEALTPLGILVEKLPVARPSAAVREAVETTVRRIIGITADRQVGQRAVLDWLRMEFGVEKPSQKLLDVAALDVDTLAGEVKKARGKKKPLSLAEVQALKAEHARTVVPLQARAAEARQLEARVSDLVNEAFGLTPEEIALMWRTAPPRTPGKMEETRG